MHLFFNKIIRSLRIYCLLFLFLVSAKMYGLSNNQYNISVMAIFHNEADYLKEWIEYNILVGVDHFYLYNQGSTDNFKKVLKPYIEQGIVESFDYAETNAVNAMNDALVRAQGESKWLAFITPSSFLFPQKSVDLKKFLSNYKKCGGVCANIQCFGTSNAASIPKGKLMIETLTQRAPINFILNSNVNYIVRPKRVQQIFDEQSFVFKSPYFAVHNIPSFATENKQNSTNSVAPVQADILLVNFYYTRDLSYFNSAEYLPYQTFTWWSKPVIKEAIPLMNEVNDQSIANKYGNPLMILMNE